MEEKELSPYQREEVFQTSATYELVRGGKQKFVLTIGNPFDADLQDVNIELTGFLSQYLHVEPTYIPKIRERETGKVTTYIEAPKYFTQGSYNLSYTISGLINETKIRGNKTWHILTRMKESRSVVLIVHEISENKAEEYREKGTEFASQMNESGLYIKGINELLLQLKENLDNKNYGTVESIYKEIKQKKESAFSALEILNEIKKKIEEAEHNGIDTPKTQRLVFLSKAALNRGDFQLALKRAEDAKMTFGLETAGKFNAFAFVKNNWQMLSMGTAVIIILAYFASIALRFQLINKKLKSLREEENILLGLIKEIQRECFEKGKLSMGEYMESLSQYEKKMSRVIQNIIRMETMKANLFKLFKRERTRLNEERQKLINMIEDTQKLYLQSGKLETRIYKNRMKSYSKRLAEVEENIADVEAREALKRQEETVLGRAKRKLKKRKKKGRKKKKEPIIKSFVSGLKTWWREIKEIQEIKDRQKKELKELEEKLKAQEKEEKQLKKQKMETGKDKGGSKIKNRIGRKIGLSRKKKRKSRVKGKNRIKNKLRKAFSLPKKIGKRKGKVKKKGKSGFGLLKEKFKMGRKKSKKKFSLTGKITGKNIIGAQKSKIKKKILSLKPEKSKVRKGARKKTPLQNFTDWWFNRTETSKEREKQKKKLRKIKKQIKRKGKKGTYDYKQGGWLYGFAKKLKKLLRRE